MDAVAKVRGYEVRLFDTPEGYAVSCPALPGCWSEGDDAPEALRNIEDAIHEWLAANRVFDDRTQARDRD